MKIPTEDKRGYFAIGVENIKTNHNVGSLWRSADLFGAAYMFTTGRRYKLQSSDTMNSFKHIPLFAYDSIDDVIKNLPFSCPIIGVELTEDAVGLETISHPPRAVYLLGSEDNGLSKKAIEMCHKIVRLPGRHSMNVSVAGSIVMYDRWRQLNCAN